MFYLECDMTRTILHSDCNNFYASVACALDPSLRGQALAVCGDREKRHGIVLAKSEQAKAYGVKTGDTIWQAQQKCPGLKIIAPDFDHYCVFSRRMREIYADYTDQVEPFGLDECWLDVTGSPWDGVDVAAKIRRRARQELGITASVGVSFNKVFAKLGSDLRKPDATTVITRENFRDKLWGLPVEDLLFVGRQTCQGLHTRGLYTIGDVARADAHTLHAYFGKSGDTLHAYALGLDESPVRRIGETEPIKSIGNSTTLCRDLSHTAEVRLVLRMLSDEVAARLRENGVRCRVVSLWVRDNALHSFERQRHLPCATCVSEDLFAAAFSLFQAHYAWHKPVRSLGIRTAQLEEESRDQQSVLPDTARQRQETLERTLDALRSRFGERVIDRALMMTDPALSGWK